MIKGSDLAGTIARHPMHKLGGFFAKPRPFLPGEFVTTDQGTGLVHMAPDHGEDDFELCKAHGIDPVFAVEAGRHLSRGLGVARRPGQRHQRQVQRARRADLLRPARGGGAARGVRGLPAQLSAFVAVEGQGHLPLHPAMVHRDGPAASQLALRELRGAALGQRGRSNRADADAPPAGDAGDRRHPLRARKGPQPHRVDGRGAARLGAQPPARVGRADRGVRRAQDRRAAGRP